MILEIFDRMARLDCLIGMISTGSPYELARRYCLAF